MMVISRRLMFFGGALLLGLVIPASVVLTAFKGGGDAISSYPSYSDQAAADFFHSHRSDFERLRSLVEQHPFVLLDVKDSAETPPAASVKDPQAKADLLRLMQVLRVRYINGTKSSWGIRLVFLVNAGTSKSFFYSKEKPKNIVPLIDRFMPNAPAPSSVSKSLSDNWYLHFEWGG